MKFLKKYLVPAVAVILLLVACVQINILNTESLAPLGTSDDNFQLVSEEFGEDFQEFIMDKSPIKIYVGEEQDNSATVKIYNKEINLTSDNFFMNTIKKVTNAVSGTFSLIKDKIYKSTNNNEENKNYTEFDKTVDDFINVFNENNENQ